MEQFRRVDDLIVNAPDMLAAAIIHEDRRYRYQDIHNGMLDVAGTLVSLDLYTDKIIVLLGNRPEAIMAIMGISYAGGTFIPLPNTIRAHRLKEIINDCGATAIITDDSFLPITEEVSTLEETPTLRAVLLYDELHPHHQNTPYPPLRSNPAYPAALMYTSGTTGKAKGVICPHHKIMEAVASINAYLLHTPHDLVATPLPLSHGYGLYQVLTLLDAGGSVMLENNFSFPQQTLERIKKYHVSGFAAVPSMIHMLVQTEGWVEYLGKIDYITTAGAALPPSTFSMLKAKLPYTQIIPMYGQAECIRALFYPSDKQGCETHLNSCGIPIPDTKTRVLRNGKKHKKGEGELLVKSPHVMDGYWNNPDETSTTFVDGWLHTGDTFGIDDDGLHYFMGRKDEVVKIKGERCSPQELDNALMAMPEIDEAASFVVDDPVWGKRFVAYVSSKDYILKKNDVRRYCKRTQAPFLMPKDVVVVGSIPKTDSGKISRKALKAMYEIMTSGDSK